jgi:hypothetical protein
MISLSPYFTRKPFIFKILRAKLPLEAPKTKKTNILQIEQKKMWGIALTPPAVHG